MAIPIPTVDDFKETTVMQECRAIVDYIINTLVPAINEGGGGSSYVLPPATTSTLGGVIVGDNLTVDGTGKVNAPTPYTLPIGGTNIGGVKNGGNVTIESDGTMNASVSSEWEELDLSNLPSDFKVDDELEITFMISTTKPTATDWDTTPPSVSVIPVSVALSYYTIVRANLDVSYSYPRSIITMESGENYTIFTGLSRVSGASYFNSSDTTKSLFSINVYAINGGGMTISAFDITKTNITSYVYKIKRKKA